jgi:hypothetical protein
MGPSRLLYDGLAASFIPDAAICVTSNVQCLTVGTTEERHKDKLEAIPTMPHVTYCTITERTVLKWGRAHVDVNNGVCIICLIYNNASTGASSGLWPNGTLR